MGSVAIELLLCASMSASADEPTAVTAAEQFRTMRRNGYSQDFAA
jgi:hypothetical protein